MKARVFLSFVLALVVPVAWLSLVACASVDSAGIDKRLQTARSTWIGWTGNSLLVVKPPDTAPSDMTAQRGSCDRVVSKDGRTHGYALNLSYFSSASRLVYAKQWMTSDQPGFRIVGLHTIPEGRFVRVRVWGLVLIVTILACPLAFCAGLKWDRLRRVRNGRCVVCGYSLFGNQSGICPECGMQIVPTVSNDSSGAT